MSAIALAPSAVVTATALAATATATAALAIDLATHRGAMLRFARRKIRDEELAEDAVQDALLAALSSRESFQGKSALRTWLIGILNHKIQDVFRRESRYVRQTAPEGSDGEPANSHLKHHPCLMRHGRNAIGEAMRTQTNALIDFTSCQQRLQIVGRNTKTKIILGYA